MQPSVEHMVATFAHRQLMQALERGTEMGLSPITTASTLLQVTAACLAGIAQAPTIAVLRAYADVIEAGPGSGPAQDRARLAFVEAAQSFIDAHQASRNFPQPQGRA